MEWVVKRGVKGGLPLDARNLTFLPVAVRTISPSSGRIWPKLCQAVEIGPNPAKVGATTAEDGHVCPGIDSMWAALGHFQQQMARKRPNLVQTFGPESARFIRSWPVIDQSWLEIDPNLRPVWAEVGPVSAPRVGPTRKAE